MHSQGVDSIDIQRKKKIPYCHPKHVDRSLEISIAVKEQKEEVLKTMQVSVEEIYGITMDKSRFPTAATPSIPRVPETFYERFLNTVLGNSLQWPAHCKKEGFFTRVLRFVAAKSIALRPMPKHPTASEKKNPQPVVQKLDSAIHWINFYQVDNIIGFPNTYSLHSDLSDGQRHAPFEQPGIFYPLRLFVLKHWPLKV